jgi:uncharacterized protein (UPF0262 family)
MKHLYQLAVDLDADVLEVRIEPGAFEVKVTATHFLTTENIQQSVIIREDDDSIPAFFKALKPFRKAVKDYNKQKGK